jgi:hypothetical protein
MEGNLNHEVTKERTAQLMTSRTSKGRKETRLKISKMNEHTFAPNRMLLLLSRRRFIHTFRFASEAMHHIVMLRQQKGGHGQHSATIASLDFDRVLSGPTCDEEARDADTRSEETGCDERMRRRDS